ncbi:SDR family NAD(P)-dependent oxidoreductase [Psychromonas sp. 14N.309.X.WAT.B.A12]|uniref:SDR family NAD(P)-dependent oxidoreductase n=1 Tax=Psychromonas sp. 14N.309.X.WAT.B.A12 TaxID=2998322 RepID=UPI0025B0333A|nr:SDR family NAD(P)-dependent oxidoreductase [Psychromonas sp. 14N.309.X.WAT.B.A12]MDN2663397.1 SDR family NAD(P)-dependent oxidoreductase [Psychromonas sp. 14N.309.X.WAT.B.A12]
MTASQRPVVLITGATAGFGLATAKKFAQQGYPLVITGRREERLKALTEELSPLTSVYYAVLDVRSSEAVAEFTSNLPDAFKQVAILVNNAGLALGAEPADQAKLSDWHTMIDTNVTGLVNVTHSFLATLKAQPSSTIINLASIAGNWAYPGSHVYGASKAFVAQFSRNLRSDFAGTGIRVTSLEPGMAESEFSLVRFNGDQNKYDQIYQGANAIQPEDIADIILWIAEQPAHLNINSLEVMPTSQAWDNFKIVKK